MNTKKILATILLVILTLSQSTEVVHAKKVSCTQTDIDYRLEYINMDWWKCFDDKFLEEYIYAAIEKNYDLKNATLKADEYQKYARMSLGRELPHVSIGADYAYLRTPNIDLGDVQFDSRNSNLFIVPMIVSYEIDLFLRNRDKTRSAKKAYEASIYAEKAAYISLISAVATIYFNIVQSDRLIELQNEIISTQKNILILTKQRNKNGLDPDNKVFTAEQELLKANISLAEMEKQRSSLLNQLAILTGESPENSDCLSRTKFENLVFKGKIPTEIDTDVVFSRPDVMQAEAELAKAKIDIRIARKEFLPRIPLIGNLGFSSIEFSKLFNWDSTFALLGAGVMQSVFAGGTKITNLKIKKNKYEQLFNNYKKTDLVALQEINDSLCIIKYDTISNNNAKKQLLLEQKNYVLTQKKYEQGLISFMTKNQLNNKLLLISQESVKRQNQEFLSYITLYKATGAKL